MRTLDRIRRIFVVVFSVLTLLISAAPANAAPARQVGTAVGRAVKARLLRIARLDRAAHRRAVTHALKTPRTVFRYVTSSRAGLELRRGFTRLTHFTTRATAGRPLSALRALRRYGLPRQPARRLTVTLPKGTPIKSLKAHGGMPGVGEVVTTRRLQSSAANVRVVPIK